MRSWLIFAGLAALVMGISIGCSSSPRPSSGTDRSALDADSQAAIADFEQRDPTLTDVLKNSDGYAIFPSIGKGAVIIGGAYGQGEVFEQGKLVGYASMTQGSLGLSLGGQSFAELLIFQTQNATQQFQGQVTSLTAQASAVAAEAGAGAAAKFSNGVAVFVNINSGLMADASIGGQRFDYEPK